MFRLFKSPFIFGSGIAYWYALERVGKWRISLSFRHKGKVYFWKSSLLKKWRIGFLFFEVIGVKL